jgi:RimJ/RimL family protein N-acetyltransferase
VLEPGYPISTERLRLRPYQDDDLDYLADVLARPEVVRYLYDEPLERDQVPAELEKRRTYTAIRGEGDRLMLAVETAETGEVVGDVSLAYRSRAHRSGEIGWIFHPDHHGHGYATEAARVMLRLGFEDLGLHRIVARCDGRNEASIRVMERLSMRREAHLVENEYLKGEWTDEIVYAMLAREWYDLRPT